MQILRNTPATLQLDVYQNGDLTDLDANPTLAITDATGAVVSSGTVSKPGSTTGIYRSTLPAQANVAELTAVWSGDLSAEPVTFTHHHQVVGNFLFTEAQARAWETSGQQTPLSDATDYPDEVIVRMRDKVTEQFESRAGRSFIRRYCRTELHGNGLHEINLHNGHSRDVNGEESGGPGRLQDIRKLISVTVDGTVVTLTDIKLHGRKLLNTATTWTLATWSNPFNVVVEYEYGLDPTPFEANEEGIRVAVTNLVRGDISQLAQSFTAEDGTITYPQGGFVYPPQTVEWLERAKAFRIPVVA